MKIEFSRRLSQKYSNIKFHENPSTGSRVVPCGQADGRTDRHDEANSRFSQFCERALKFNKAVQRQDTLVQIEFQTLQNFMFFDLLINLITDGHPQKGINFVTILITCTQI